MIVQNERESAQKLAASLGKHMARLGSFEPDRSGLLLDGDRVILVTDKGERLEAKAPDTLKSPDALWENYEACPLFATEKVVWYETTPYVGTVAVLLSSSCTGSRVEGSLVFDGTRRGSGFLVETDRIVSDNGWSKAHRYVVDLQVPLENDVVKNDRVLRMRLTRKLVELVGRGTGLARQMRSATRYQFDINNLFLSRPAPLNNIRFWGSISSDFSFI